MLSTQNTHQHIWNVSLTDNLYIGSFKMNLNQSGWRTVINSRGFSGFQSTLEIIFFYFEHSLSRVLPLNGVS